jgi:hypothetical protein
MSSDLLESGTPTASLQVTGYISPEFTFHLLHLLPPLTTPWAVVLVVADLDSVASTERVFPLTWGWKHWCAGDELWL